MRIGIIGLAAAGKSTLFAAFMGTGEPAATSKQTTGVVNVPDHRVDELSAFCKPRKTTYATVIFEDCVPLDTPVKSDRIKLYDSMKTMDAYVVVIGAYRCPDAKTMADEAGKAHFELIINDLDFVTKRIEKLEREIKISKDRAIKEKEMELLQRLQPVLEKEQSLFGMEFSEQESGIMSNYNLLTTKPVMYVLNVSQDLSTEEMHKIQDEAGSLIQTKVEKAPVVAIKGTLETEVAAMEPDEIDGFMEEFGIEELARDLVIKEAYHLLNLITFFTVGEDECRAWTLREGGSAVDAAGTIHTDLARGFIRAEVIDYRTLLELGGIPEARKAGKLRLEGKTYVVKDGEVVHIMFNI